MRRISFVRPFCLLLVAAVAFAGFALQSPAQGASSAQQGPLAPTAVSDPAAVNFLLDAARHYGLGPVNGAPALAYKLKAQFEVLAPDGSVTDRGKYEEIVKDALHSRTTYESNAFKQTKFFNGGPARVTGSRAGMPPDPYNLIILALFQPLGSEAALRRNLVLEKQAVVRSENREIAGKPVRCYALTVLRLSPSHGPSATYCFNEAGTLEQTTLAVLPSEIVLSVSRTIEYQGRQIPAEVEFRRKDMPGLRLHVESIEPPNGNDDASFVALPEAVAPDPIVVHLPNSSVQTAPIAPIAK
jgi:hypothetical protein